VGSWRVLRHPFGVRKHRRDERRGVEVIGVDGDGYRSTFYDSFGNVHSSRVEIDGDVIKWFGDRTRCVATITDRGMTQVAHHEVTVDGTVWSPSMDVTLRKVR
jgi:hypothetical protein